MLVFFDDELTTFRNKNYRFICNVKKSFLKQKIYPTHTAEECLEQKTNCNKMEKLYLCFNSFIIYIYVTKPIHFSLLNYTLVYSTTLHFTQLNSCIFHYIPLY